MLLVFKTKVEEEIKELYFYILIEIIFQNDKFRALVIALFLYAYHDATVAALLKRRKTRNIGKIDRFSFRKTHSRLIGIEQFQGGNSGSRRTALRSRRKEKGWNTAFRKPGILVPCWKKW